MRPKKAFAGSITEKILLIIVNTPSKWPGLFFPHNSFEIDGAFIITKSFAKYYSRLDFEKLIYSFPKGYDTPIKKLVIIGDMIKSNKLFFNNFYE